MPQDLDYSLYFNIAFFGILGLGLLVGLGRGLKKSLYSFITMVIFYAVFFLTIDAVVGALWTMDVPQLGTWLGNLDSGFAGVTTFRQATEIGLQMVLGDTVDLASLSASASDLIAGLGIFVLKIVYTVLYFTVILLLYKILVGIIRLIFFGSRKGESKNALLGGVFGLANGALALFVLLIVFGGVMSVAGSLVALSPSSGDSGDTVELAMPRQEAQDLGYSLIPLAEGEDTPDPLSDVAAFVEPVVSAYEDNLLVKAVGIITIRNDSDTLDVPLNLYLFDKVASFDFNGQKVALRNELAVFAAAAQVILASDFSASGEIADLQGDEVRQVFEYLSASDFLVGALPAIIEIAADNFDVTLNVTEEEFAAIDWHEELVTLGDIAGSLLDIMNEQQTTGTITADGDTIRNLFDEMGNSQLMLLVSESILEPWLSDPANADALSFLVIPGNLDWSAEFPAIGNALGAIVDETGAFVLDNLGLQAVVEMSDATIGLLFQSRILVATVSKLLTGDSLTQDMELVIPNDVLDSDGYVSEEELTALATALKLLVSSVMGGESEFDPAAILAMDETDIDTILSSEILWATMGKKIYDLGTTGTFVVPSGVVTPVEDGTDTVSVITAAEIKAVFQALQALGAEGFDTVSFDAGILATFESDTVPGTLDGDLLDTLLSSRILHATVSKMILDLAGDQDLLVIPEQAADGTPILGSDGTAPLILKDELKAAMNAMFAIGTIDFATLGGMDVSLILNHTAVLLDSAILHATISDLLLTGTSGILVIPDSVRIVRGTVTYVDDAEILAIVDALDAMSLDHLSSLSFDPSAILSADYATILDSASMQATVSASILGFASDGNPAPDGPTLIVPDALREDIVVAGITQTLAQIEKSELIALLDSIGLLGDFGSFGSSFPATSITSMDGATLDQLLLSGSIHATLSNMAFLNSQVETYVPDIAVQSLYGLPEVIIASEIRDFILAVHYLGTDFTSVDIDYSGVAGLTQAERTEVLKSYIVRGIITPATILAVQGRNVIHDPDFNLDAEDYEVGYVGTLLTYPDSLDIMNWLNGDDSVTD